MNLVVNGERRAVDAGLTVSELLRELGLDGRPCAVEINAELAPKREHDERTLSEGDTVEVVTLVGGG